MLTDHFRGVSPSKLFERLGSDILMALNTKTEYVMAHNLIRKLDKFWDQEITPKRTNLRSFSGENAQKALKGTYLSQFDSKKLIRYAPSSPDLKATKNHRVFSGAIIKPYSAVNSVEFCQKKTTSGMKAEAMLLNSADEGPKVRRSKPQASVTCEYNLQPGSNQSKRRKNLRCHKSQSQSNIDKMVSISHLIRSGCEQQIFAPKNSENQTVKIDEVFISKPKEQIILDQLKRNILDRRMNRLSGVETALPQPDAKKFKSQACLDQKRRLAKNVQDSEGPSQIEQVSFVQDTQKNFLSSRNFLQLSIGKTKNSSIVLCDFQNAETSERSSQLLKIQPQKCYISDQYHLGGKSKNSYSSLARRIEILKKSFYATEKSEAQVYQDKSVETMRELSNPKAGKNIFNSSRLLLKSKTGLAGPAISSSVDFSQAGKPARSESYYEEIQEGKCASKNRSQANPFARKLLNQYSVPITGYFTQQTCSNQSPSLLQNQINNLNLMYSEHFKAQDLGTGLHQKKEHLLIAQNASELGSRILNEENSAEMLEEPPSNNLFSHNSYQHQRKTSGVCNLNRQQSAISIIRGFSKSNKNDICKKSEKSSVLLDYSSLPIRNTSNHLAEAVQVSRVFKSKDCSENRAKTNSRINLNRENRSSNDLVGSHPIDLPAKNTSRQRSQKNVVGKFPHSEKIVAKSQNFEKISVYSKDRRKNIGKIELKSIVSMEHGKEKVKGLTSRNPATIPTNYDDHVQTFDDKENSYPVQKTENQQIKEQCSQRENQKTLLAVSRTDQLRKSNNQTILSQYTQKLSAPQYLRGKFVFPKYQRKESNTQNAKKSANSHNAALVNSVQSSVMTIFQEFQVHIRAQLGFETQLKQFM